MKKQTLREKLLAKATEYEQRAQGLRYAAEELGEEITTQAQEGMDRRMEQAIALTRQRAKSNGHRSRSGTYFPKAARTKRLISAKLLDKIAKSPTPVPRTRLAGHASLITHGYLRLEGDGYVRTEKPFTP